MGLFDGSYWNPPSTWFSRQLTDWEMHACSQKCLNFLLENHQSSPQGFPIKEFVREIGPDEPNSDADD